MAISAGLALVLGAALCLSFTSMAQGWCDDGQDHGRVILEKHNEFRSRHGVDGLQWDDGIADSAEAWAHNLIGNPGCVLEHEQNGQNGENLMSVTSDVSMENSCVAATEGWYNERFVPGYDFNTKFPYSSQWGRKMIGHFTQVVWENTKLLGCGAAWKNENNKFCYVQVCQYYPPGNVVGDDNFLANVLKPTDSKRRSRAMLRA